MSQEDLKLARLRMLNECMMILQCRMEQLEKWKEEDIRAPQEPNRVASQGEAHESLERQYIKATRPPAINRVKEECDKLRNQIKDLEDALGIQNTGGRPLGRRYFLVPSIAPAEAPRGRGEDEGGEGTKKRPREVEVNEEGMSLDISDDDSSL